MAHFHVRTLSRSHRLPKRSRRRIRVRGPSRPGPQFADHAVRLARRKMQHAITGSRVRNVAKLTCLYRATTSEIKSRLIRSDQSGIRRAAASAALDGPRNMSANDLARILRASVQKQVQAGCIGTCGASGGFNAAS